MSLNALDVEQTQQLRAHLETCTGCRRYLAEISNVTEKLAEVHATPDVEASESFHRKVAGRLRTARPDSIAEILAACFRGSLLNSRVALPAIAALVVIGVTIAIWRQPPKISQPPRTGTQIASVENADIDPAPTIANYQRVANQSLDKLDALLTKQGNRPLPPMPTYTASTLGLAQEPF